MPANLASNILNAAMSQYTNADNLYQQQQIFNKNANLQREFAQNSIQWRVNDAKRAGIHPLYALGAQGSSYTPQSLDFQAQAPRFNLDFSSLMQLEGTQLQNKLLETQIETQQLENKQRKLEYQRDFTGFSNSLLGQNSNQQNLINNGLQKKSDDIQGVSSKVVPQAQNTAKPQFDKVPLVMRIEPTADESDKVESLGILNKINYWKDYHWDGHKLAVAQRKEFERRVNEFFKKNPKLDRGDYSIVLRGDKLRGYQWQLEHYSKWR